MDSDSSSKINYTKLRNDLFATANGTVTEEHDQLWNQQKQNQFIVGTEATATVPLPATAVPGFQQPAMNWFSMPVAEKNDDDPQKELRKISYGSYGSCTSSQGTASDASGPCNGRRAFSKKGLSNLTPANVDRTDWPFYRDIFTTLLDVQWRWLLGAFCLMYFASWLIFAVIWYAILTVHGDLDDHRIDDPNHIPCITNMKDFTSTFLFSVETQHTTGYGFYHITEQCPLAIITFCSQSIIGVIIEGLMVGLVFVKMMRAKKRSATLLFSKNAVITQRDGQLCFMFRVADMRNKSHLLEARVRAQLIGKRITAEGEEISFGQQELEVSGDGERYNQVLLFWPTTVIHKIGPTSPLYHLRPDDLHFENTRFEIIVVLEGIVETTGLVTQARSSYLPGEILWGHRFKNIALAAKGKQGNRVVDYSVFHETIQVGCTPWMSAYQMDMERQRRSSKQPPVATTEIEKRQSRKDEK